MGLATFIRMLVYRQGWCEVGSRRATEHGLAPPLDRDDSKFDHGKREPTDWQLQRLKKPLSTQVPLIPTCSVRMTSFLLRQGRVYRHLLPDDVTGPFRWHSDTSFAINQPNFCFAAVKIHTNREASHSKTVPVTLKPSVVGSKLRETFTRPIHSQLNWAILPCDVIAGGKLSKLRSFDRQ
jgi:hypothetical protein